MTAQRTFKQTVRERMTKTGERYTAARAALLQSHPPAPVPGVFPTYRLAGSVSADTGALRNVLAAAGVALAHTGKPPTEAVVSGVCGGVGFLYAVFEYDRTPPLLTVLTRYDTMPDSYVAGGLVRLGVAATMRETGSVATAKKHLDAVIESKTPALCVIDRAGLTEDADARLSGYGPAVVALAGADGDDLLIDDGTPTPRRVARDRFARARSAYKKAKHRLVTIDPGAGRVDMAKPARAAAAATADRYTTAPYKGFASNFGFAGMEKWRRLLTDRKDAKGWPTLFPHGRLAYLALRRTFDGLEHEYTAPAAGRPEYAEFLDGAAKATSDARFRAAADTFRAAGAAWSALTRAIETCGDATVEEGCRLGESFRELVDECGCPDEGEAARVARERQALAHQCKLSAADAAALYAALADHLGLVIDRERAAVTALKAAVG